MDLSLTATATVGGMTPPSSGGLIAGTWILTLKGSTDVADLKAGDRIVTRSGVRTLRAIREEAVPAARMIRISASALGVDQPEADLIVSPDQLVLLRDWRAKAMRGTGQAVMEAGSLIDGEYIRSETVSGFRRYTLQFDTPVVIYASGVELACTS